jgi:NAD(P)-dependent dehydrogenase (short-subunit alcohol dehydrogenase family)
LFGRSRVRSFDGRQVFVTGAASGIGRATALRAAAEGAVVHLTDLRADSLDDVAAEIRARGGAVGLVEAADISDYDAVRALAARLTAAHGAMDVVMNIAGISAWGTVRSLEHNQWRAMVEVNLMGPIHVIGVSLVCPGGVETGLTDTIDIAGVDKTSAGFRRAQSHFKKRAVSPDRAAEAILEGVRRNRYWVYTSPDIRLAHALQRHLPAAYVMVMRAMNAGANRALPAVQQARLTDL